MRMKNKLITNSFDNHYRSEFRYTAVIRTLGTAGEKYQILLDSLCRQTVQPDQILVYIPENYELPKETCGREKYIRCQKGMVHQRSLSFDEVKTEWILFCDDDISLNPESVSLLWDGLSRYQNSQCISPDVFSNSQASMSAKIKNCILGTKPHYKKEWAFIIRESGYYLYNNLSEKKRSDVLRTQSAAGPCCLISKKAYLSIHFEDERFLDDFKYALGEDILFYYKLYRMGFQPLVHYKSGIVHLDGGTSHIINKKEKIKMSNAALYTVWHRSLYSVSSGLLRKLWCGFCYWNMVIITFLLILGKGIIKLNPLTSFVYLSGVLYGIKYTCKEKYKNLPGFMSYKN